MAYQGKVDRVHPRKIRTRNTRIYRLAHWPIWVFVFFLAPGPLIFTLFAHGFSRANAAWLVVILTATGIAALRGSLPGSEPGPYILHFNEDKPNPLYRRVCYTFAWNAVLNFACINLFGLAIASTTGVWYMQQLYRFAYPVILVLVLILGIAGLLPRVGHSTKSEGTERRYFYGAVWATVIAQTILLLLWKLLPQTRTTSLVKLAVYAATLVTIGIASYRGRLPRTRPILPGEVLIAD